MTVDGLPTCPHCRAIVQSSRCSICGKSAFDEVAPPPAPPKHKFTDTFENNELQKVGAGLLLLLLLAGAVLFVLSRPDASATANALPPPASTTTVPPRPTSTEPAPSVVGGVKPASAFLPGVPREIGENLAPWETPPPVDFVTGLLLDGTLDYSTDIARVDELLAAFPEGLTLQALDPPELATFAGSVDIGAVESSQPFAARTLVADDGAVLGELRLIASGGSEAGDAYLQAARDRWDFAAAIDQYSPDVGVRLWLLGADTTINLWAGTLTDDSLVLIQTSTAIDPAIYSDALRAWGRAGS